MAGTIEGYAPIFRRVVNRITLLYLFAGGGWILFSDRILALFVPDREALVTLQTVKGWMFILVTDLFLYILLLRGLNAIEREVVLRGETEKRGEAVLQVVPVGIVELDLSAIAGHLELLERQGVTDYAQFLADNQRFLEGLMASVGIVRMNQKAIDLFGGATADDVAGSLGAVFLPESKEVFRNAVGIFLSKRERFRAELAVRTLKGERRWVIATLVVPRDRSELKSVPLTLTDITDRKKMEEKLLLLELAVQQIEEGITITTAQLDPPGPEIVYVNSAFTRITGYSADEVMGRTPRILQGPKTDRAVLDNLRQALWQRQNFHGRTVNYRKDGSEFLMEWYVVPLVNRRFEVTHFVAVQREVKERDEESARRKEANA